MLKKLKKTKRRRNRRFAVCVVFLQKHFQPQAKRKDKRQRVENADDVAKYEASEGEDEGREYDYMTDSGSESESVLFYAWARSQLSQISR